MYYPSSKRKILDGGKRESKAEVYLISIVREQVRHNIQGQL